MRGAHVNDRYGKMYWRELRIAPCNTIFYRISANIPFPVLKFEEMARGIDEIGSNKHNK